MSANNQLIIYKPKKHKNSKFEVHHNLCVDNDWKYNKRDILEKFDTLENAIKFANNYCKKEIVEYGYSIDDSCLEENKK